MVQIYERYLKEINKLNDISLVEVDIAQGNIPLWSLALTNKKEELVRFLNEKNIFPEPFHLPLSTAKYFNNQNQEFPNSMRISQKGLRLPCGPSQTNEDIDYVIKALQEFFK